MNTEPSAGADVAPDLAPAARPATEIELARWAAAVIVGLIWLVAAVLCWRRVAWALSSPLEPLGLLIVGALLATAAAAARMVRRYETGELRGRPSGWVAAAMLSVGVVAAAGGLSLPGTSPGGLVLLWSVLGIEECWAWGPAAWHRFRGKRQGHPSLDQEVGVDVPRASAVRPVPADWDSDKPPAGEVTQQMTRSRAGDGSEVLSGWLRVPIAAGQRNTNGHVAFCPPFPRTPRVTVAQLEGPRARIKTVQLLPHGARFDLKLAAPSEAAATVLLRFSAEVAAQAEPGTGLAASEGEDSAEG